MASSSVIRLLDNDVSVVASPVNEQQDKAGDSEEDAVHDAKGKAGFEHSACLVDIHAERTGSGEALRIEGDREAGVRGEVGAVSLGDVPKLVNTGDKSSDEAQIDEGDEDGGVAGRLASEPGQNGPSRGQDSDNEEDQHIGRREEVSFVPAVDEVRLQTVSVGTGKLWKGYSPACPVWE